MSDPRVEPDSAPGGSGVHAVPPPVPIPDGHAGDPFFLFVRDQAGRADLLQCEVMAVLAGLREDAKQRDEDDARQRELRRRERAEDRIRIDQIMGVLRDHGTAMGRLGEALRTLEADIGLVRETQQSHGEQIAVVSKEIARVTRHVDTGRRESATLEARVTALETKIDALERLVRADIEVRRREAHGETAGQSPDTASPTGGATEPGEPGSA